MDSPEESSNDNAINWNHWRFGGKNSHVSDAITLSYLVLVSIAFVYLVFLWCLTITALWSKKSKITIKNSIRYVSLIHSTSYICAYTMIGIMFFISSSISYGLFFIIIASLFSIGHLSFYVFLLLRIYYCFVDSEVNNSMYTITIKMIYIHCVILLIDIVLYALIWYFWHEKRMKYVIICCISAAVLLLLCIIHFIYTFNAKLFLLATNLSKSHLRTNPNNKHNIEMTHKQLQLVNAITKQTLLSMYSLFVIAFVIFSALLLWIFHHFGLYSDHLIGINIVRWLLALQRCTEVSCVYLSFAMNEKMYQMLCRKCHHMFSQYCRTKAENRIIEEQLKTQIVQLQSNSTAAPPNANNDVGGDGVSAAAAAHDNTNNGNGCGQLPKASSISLSFELQLEKDRANAMDRDDDDGDGKDEFKRGIDGMETLEFDSITKDQQMKPQRSTNTYSENIMASKQDSLYTKSSVTLELSSIPIEPKRNSSKN